jgi:hypothetical protein
MVAITNPGTNVTTFSGDYKLLALNDLTVTTYSDTMTLTFADNGISEIVAAVSTPSGGTDAAFSFLETSFSGLVVTINSFENDGTVATNFTGTTVNLLVIGK